MADSLRMVAMVVLMADRDLVSLSAVCDAWLRHFPVRMVLADTAHPKLGVEACCLLNLGYNILAAQRKLEFAFARRVLAHHPPTKVGWAWLL